MPPRFGSFLIALSAAAASACVVGSAAAQTAYEAYYRYLGNYPADANPGFHQNVQGLAHDDANWFITQATEGTLGEQSIWKVPVEVDLNSVSTAMPGVIERTLAQTPLAAEGYWHFGDPCHYEFGGVGYLVVPVEFEDLAVAIFRASDLTYITHFEIKPIQTHISWIAVHPDGTLVSSNSGGHGSGETISVLHRYSLDWALLQSSGIASWSHLGTTTLENASGVPDVQLVAVQGGEFSESGELLYVCADGIHVFEWPSAHRIQQSSNGFGTFNYQFDDSLLSQEEPEGLTVWDLDGKGAPGIGGQLHVLLLDNDVSADEISIKHYTNKIFVPQTSSSVTGAVNFGWDGAHLRIQAGSYDEGLVITKRLLLTAKDGPATIGL